MMTLPPLNTPIQHTGGATCPVHPETRIRVTIAATGEPKECWAENLMWGGVTTYTIIARAPTDEIAALQARVTELEGALIWCSGSPDFNDGGQAREGWLKICAPLLKGNPNAHD